MNASVRGNSILEVLVGTVILAGGMSALGLGILSGLKSTSQMKETNVVQNQAFSFMERVQQLSFGTDVDLPAAPSSLDQLFDDSLGLPDLTLSQLRRPATDAGMTFRIAGFESDGVWEVRVSRDFDGDHVLDADEEVADLLKIEIRFRDRLILSTYRARPAVAQ